MNKPRKQPAKNMGSLAVKERVRSMLVRMLRRNTTALKALVRGEVKTLRLESQVNRARGVHVVTLHGALEGRSDGYGFTEWVEITHHTLGTWAAQLWFRCPQDMSTCRHDLLIAFNQNVQQPDTYGRSLTITRAGVSVDDVLYPVDRVAGLLCSPFPVTADPNAPATSSGTVSELLDELGAAELADRIGATLAAEAKQAHSCGDNISARQDTRSALAFMAAAKRMRGKDGTTR